MSSYLLDTHTYIWMVSEPESLSTKVTHILLDKDNIIHLSIASLFEMSIKVSQGNLDVEQPFMKTIEQELTLYDLQLLTVYISHLDYLSRLPFHHKDPFDRLLISQAVVSGLPILTKDPLFNNYDAEIVW